MKVERVFNLETNDWVFTGLTGFHERSTECEEHGCVLHSPSAMAIANRENWPYNWSTGFMERICPHGIGHPDPDSARYLARIGLDAVNWHGCDDCCSGTAFNHPIITIKEN